jgi:hypothetical protein
MSSGTDDEQAVAEICGAVNLHAPINTVGLCLDAVRSGASARELRASGVVPDALLVAHNRQMAYESYQRLRVDKWAAKYTLEMWDASKAKGLWWDKRAPEDALVSKLFALRETGCDDCCGNGPDGDFLAMPDHWQWHDQNIRLRGVAPIKPGTVGGRFNAYSIACAARRVAERGLVIDPRRLALTSDGRLHWSSLRMEGRPGGARCSTRTQESVLSLLVSLKHDSPKITDDLRNALAEGAVCIADLSAVLGGELRLRRVDGEYRVEAP